MASLSEKLRRERELRGISLKQISEETKIGVRFLEALEENRIDLIPGEFYRRSYLRAYARYLGLDEERALNAYDYAHQASSENGNGAREASEASTVSPAPWPKWALGALLVLLALPAALLLKSESPSPTESTPAPDVESVSPSPPMPMSEQSAAPRDQGPVIPDVPMAQTAPVTDGLELVLAVDEACWLEIEADGEIVTSGLKDGGFRQEVTASREVKLWLGNAGGVSVWLNGRPAKALGRAGQVRKDLSITPDNYTQFLVAGSS
jgi:cytoskeleton protein RodZ